MNDPAITWHRLRDHIPPFDTRLLVKPMDAPLSIYALTYAEDGHLYTWESEERSEIACYGDRWTPIPTP